MDSKHVIFFTQLVLCLQSYHALAASNRFAPKIGSCSTKCLSNSKTEGLQQNSNRNWPKFHCSCSPSCQIYGDCCYDSEYRTKGNVMLKSELMCLNLMKKGRYLAVHKCAPNWRGSTEFCSGTIGHLPPVTSRITGTTYANLHCAICNNDMENLFTWDVELKCCREHDHIPEGSIHRYVYSNGELWSNIGWNSRSDYRKCLCKFSFLHENDVTLDSLELRLCNLTRLTSACSPAWKDGHILSLCKSYLDPRCFGSKTYRNLHCALCNYENLAYARCMPQVVENMLSSGLNASEVLKQCEAQELLTCIQFLEGTGRGRNYPSSRMFKINVRPCVPDLKKHRCCEGKKFDFRSEQCRD